MQAENLWSKLHSGDRITWTGHAFITLIIMTISFFGSALLGDYSFNEQIIWGVWPSLVHWLLREAGDLIPKFIAYSNAKKMKNLRIRAETQEALTDGIKDGLGDFFAPVITIALFTAITFPIFGGI